MITAGIDAGSRAIKIVVFDTDQGTILASAICDQGVDQRKLAFELLERLLEENKIKRNDVGRMIASGYGRHLWIFAIPQSQRSPAMLQA